NRKRGTQRRLVPDRQEHVNFSRRELTIVFIVAFDVRCLDIVEREIPAFLIAKFGHALEEIFIMWGLSGLHTDKADSQHLVLLGLRCKRPRRRAADERDELAPSHVEHAASLRAIRWPMTTIDEGRCGRSPARSAYHATAPSP